MGEARLRTGNGSDELAHVELVRSLSAALAPALIMTALFAIVAATAVEMTGDGPLKALAVIGVAASVIRVTMLSSHRRRLDDPALDRSAAAAFERNFGFAYLGFAIALGLFGARAVAIAPIELHMGVAALITGYGAGVATGIALRPRLGAVSMVAGIVPTIAVLAIRGDLPHLLVAVILAALLVGGIGSMMTRYRIEVEKIALRQLNGSLARTDHLTGLANRLGLAERWSAAGVGTSRMLAIHCIDLDGFKPVNDVHGHPAGDELLRQVARRVGSLLRDGDFAARLGGDEFAVFQSGLSHPQEAELMSRRLSRALAGSYDVGRDTVEIGASVGFAVGSGGDSLEELVAAADDALYKVKRQRRTPNMHPALIQAHA